MLEAADLCPAIRTVLRPSRTDQQRRFGPRRRSERRRGQGGRSGRCRASATRL